MKERYVGQGGWPGVAYPFMDVILFGILQPEISAENSEGLLVELREVSFFALGGMLTDLADAPESATDLTANSANPLGVEQIWWQVHFSLFDGLRLLGSNVDRSMSMQLSLVEVVGHGVLEGHVNLPSP